MDNLSSANIDNNWNGWTAGKCIADTNNGRKKRNDNMGQNRTEDIDEDIYEDIDEVGTGDISTDRTEERAKRSTEVDLTKERKVECVSWLGGLGAYWKYDHEVPSRCHSKSVCPLITV